MMLMRSPHARAATVGCRPRASPGRTTKTIPTRTGASVIGSHRRMVRRPLAAPADDDPRRPVVVVGRRRFSTRGSSSSSSSSSDGGRRGSSSSGRAFQLDALPFSVPPSEAYAKFERWARDEQGLGPLLSAVPSGGGVARAGTIAAAYAPFWYFEMNVRFVAPTSGRASRVVPEPLRSAYPDPPGTGRGGGAIHLPGLASYAGFAYRRTLVDPVHNAAPIFLRGDIVPFRKWMLDPLEYNGMRLEVFPDPWNATRERAYSAIRDELRAAANGQYRERTGSAAGDGDADGDGDGDDGVRVETERLSARRIYMPTYVVDYAVLGISYRAVISGCDPRASVSGVSHSVFGTGGGAPAGGAFSFLSDLHGRVAPAAAGALQFLGPRPLLALARAALVVLSRAIATVPIVGVLGGGAFVLAWRKLLRPYVDDRSATAEWERRREHESRKSGAHDVHEDSFRDDGAARAYFLSNEERILKCLRGEEERRDDRDDQREWYARWEEWAREQWEKAQREASGAQEEFHRQRKQGRTDNRYHQQSRQRQRQQQQGRRQYKQARKDDDFKWDFDEGDPWSVLGLPRNSSKEEVSKAFRREMLKHHPDLQSQNSEQEKRRATERSKIISDAYRKIKASYAKR